MNDAVRLQAWKDQLTQDELDLVERIESMPAGQAVPFLAVNVRREIEAALAKMDLAHQERMDAAIKRQDELIEKHRIEMRAMKSSPWRSAAVGSAIGVIGTIAAFLGDVQDMMPG